jgi:molybdopterin-guanine dinucleotide biosynthesis protein A
MMGGMKRRIRCGGKPMTAIVLAGGRGRRMKADKAGLDVGGKPLLEHVLAQVEPYFDEILISLSPGQDLQPFLSTRASHPRQLASPSRPSASHIRVVHDETPGLGPIGGLLAGLKAAKNDACLVVACDIPEVPSPLLRSLGRAARDAEIAVAVDPAGHYEPLFAVYKRPVVGPIEALLARGERSLLPLFRSCRTTDVRMENKLRLRNLNTRADYESYLRSIGKTGSSKPTAPAERGGRKRS